MKRATYALFVSLFLILLTLGVSQQTQVITGQSVSSLVSAVAANTISLANFPQVWNWAQTSNSQNGMTLAESSAATNGTLGSQYQLQVKTITGSTAVPLNITQSLSGTQNLPALHITPTWNVTGIPVDAAILVNVTNTASNVSAKLMDLQVGGTSEATINRQGIQMNTGNRVFVTANFTTASTSLVAITGLTWSFGSSDNFIAHSFHCHGSYSQATAAAANAFGIQATTTAPTNLYIRANAHTSATASTELTTPTVNSTTATNIVTFTPSAFGAIGTQADEFGFDFFGTLEQGAGATGLQFLVLTGSASDSITVYRGSYCELEP